MCSESTVAQCIVHCCATVLLAKSHIDLQQTSCEMQSNVCMGEWEGAMVGSQTHRHGGRVSIRGAAGMWRCETQGGGAGQAKPGKLSAVGACSPSVRANRPIQNANLQIGWAQAARRARCGGAEGQTLWLRPQTIMFPVLFENV